MKCRCRGFVTIRHNDVRDFEAALLSKVCKDVETEPILQPVTGEVLPKTDAAGDEARPDVRARGQASLHGAPPAEARTQSGLHVARWLGALSLKPAVQSQSATERFEALRLRLQQRAAQGTP